MYVFLQHIFLSLGQCLDVLFIKENLQTKSLLAFCGNGKFLTAKISLIVCQLKNFKYYNVRLPFVVVCVATSVMTQSPHAGSNVLSHYKKIPNEKANFSIMAC